jgi:hypothetical protein
MRQTGTGAAGLTSATFSRAVSTGDPDDFTISKLGSDTMMEACGTSNTLGYHRARWSWLHDWTATATSQAAAAATTTAAPAAVGVCGMVSRTVDIPKCDMSVVSTFSGSGAAARVTFDVTMKRAAWFALGINPQGTMAGSYAVIAKPGVAGAGALQEYSIGGYTSGAVVAHADVHQNLEAAVVVQAGGQTTASFTRLVTTADSADTPITCASPQTLVFACGTGNGFGQHAFGDRGSLVYDWSSGVGAAKESGMSAGAIALHAGLMVIGWALLIPCGVAFASLFKGFSWWFRMHRLLVVAGLLAVTVGFAVIVSAKGDAGGAHFGGGHQQIGLAVMLLGWLQPLNAFLRPHATDKGGKPTCARLLWERLHKTSGRVAIVLGIVACVSGLAKIGPTELDLKDKRPGLVALFAISVVAVASLVMYGCTKRAKDMEAKGKEAKGQEVEDEDGASVSGGHTQQSSSTSVKDETATAPAPAPATSTATTVAATSTATEAKVVV